MISDIIDEFEMDILGRELENDSGSEQHSRMLELIYSLPFFPIPINGARYAFAFAII